MSGDRPDGHPAEERFRHHRLIRRVDMRPHWGKQPGQGEQGTMRATWTPIDASNARAGLMFIGPGQTSPASSFSTEHILLHLQGRLVYEVEGERYALEEHDLLFVPAYVPYELTNVGDDWGWWFSVNLRLDEWPGRAFRGDVEQELGLPWPFDDEGRRVQP
jgi:quercetin dioxygenase-like cupin family protein